jgi:catechol 2,3-dioxygenase-like lactoylglutathione lyase family enzyme
MNLDGIDHVALAVDNIERAAQWYIDVLGFERRHEGVWGGVPTFLGKGTTGVALFPPRETESEPETHTGKGRFLHLAFRADAKNFAVAQKELNERGIKYHFQDHEISHSIYFRDPDGHELEITTYDLDGGGRSDP